MHKPSVTATPAGRLQLPWSLQLMTARQPQDFHQLAQASPAQPVAQALPQAMALATEAAQLMYPSLCSPSMATTSAPPPPSSKLYRCFVSLSHQSY